MYGLCVAGFGGDECIAWCATGFAGDECIDLMLQGLVVMSVLFVCCTVWW